MQFPLDSPRAQISHVGPQIIGIPLILLFPAILHGIHGIHPFVLALLLHNSQDETSSKPEMTQGLSEVVEAAPY